MSPIGELVSGRPVNRHRVPGIVRTASLQAFNDPRRTIPCDFFVSQSSVVPSLEATEARKGGLSRPNPFALLRSQPSA